VSAHALQTSFHVHVVAGNASAGVRIDGTWLVCVLSLRVHIFAVSLQTSTNESSIVALIGRTVPQADAMDLAPEVLLADARDESPYRRELPGYKFDAARA
jgi:hypothetical protein